MERSDFVHLHVHSQYSLLDGAIRFEEVFNLGGKLGFLDSVTDSGQVHVQGRLGRLSDALALGDHQPDAAIIDIKCGNLFGHNQSP